MPLASRRALPANPNLDWLRKAAKKRLAALRAGNPYARLHQAQLAVAHDYGFKSWRALKAHVAAIAPAPTARDRVFAAAGEVEAVRRAFAAGFDPASRNWAMPARARAADPRGNLPGQFAHRLLGCLRLVAQVGIETWA